MYIYKITNLQNNKVYIGRTIQSLKTRWAQHKSRGRSLDAKTIKHSHKLYNDMQLYGIDEFICEPIYKATTIEDLHLKEKEFIKKYNSIDSGYNLVYGDIISHKSLDSEELNKIKEVLSIGVSAYWKTVSKEERCAIAQKTMHSISFETRQANTKMVWDSLNSDERSKIAQKGMQSKRARGSFGMYTLISPSGVYYKHIDDITSFCKLHELKRNCIYHIIKGNCKSHKGWTVEIERHPIKFHARKYTFRSPDGVDIIVTNITEFCTLYNLSRGSIGCIIGGVCKQHKGWTLINE